MTLNKSDITANEIQRAAWDASHKYINEYFDGQDRGACGFAWVTLYPEHKGNTKLGKAERREFERLGASKDWTGKAWMLWNPAQYPVQSIDVLLAGAHTAAQVLREYGFNASASSRLD
jgi:hypothetical protein